MITQLIKYYLSLHYWSIASLDSIKKMQLKKFAELFDHAKNKSRFYREYYGDNGILDLKIKSYDDINRVPLINKALLRNYPIQDIMTCDLDASTRIHSTSGSTGEPFRIAFNRYEGFTAHMRVFRILRKAGYKITDKIIMVVRNSEKNKLEIEGGISGLGFIQKKLNLLQREIISIYEPVDEIIDKLINSKAKILWSTPGIMQIVALRLKERGIRLNLSFFILYGENFTAEQQKIFMEYICKNIVNLYGCMESPSLGFDPGLTGKFFIFPNSSLFQFENIKNEKGETKSGNVIITNLINKTMPLIRYDLHDLAEIDDNPEFGHRYINQIIGKQNDILKLNNGKYMTHTHIYGLFRDFHECEMFKFIQKKDDSILLQIKAERSHDRKNVEKLAIERWNRQFSDVPVVIEFVNSFNVNLQTGKFKIVEKEV